jgi:hypothetical protein
MEIEETAMKMGVVQDQKEAKKIFYRQFLSDVVLRLSRDS